MRELVIDLTPACVNKTAIRHIALDTLHALGSRFRTTFQYRGDRTERLADGDQEISVSTLFHDDLERWTREPGNAAVVVPGKDDRTPRLYFDPIYTLYGPLKPNDVVFFLDMSPLTDPEWHPLAVSNAYKKAFAHVMQSRAQIVCISAHCAAGLRSAFAISSAEITTVPLYLRHFPSDVCPGSIPPSPYAPKGRFILFVGSLETRKNLIGLIHAFASSGLVDAGWRLACAGGSGHGAEAILEAADEIEGVDMLGFIPDDELEWLYANAGLFAYPSFLEGFGLPLLEAMSHGLPCLASTTGASSEICGDLAVTVDPYDIPAIAEGLRSCAESGRDAPWRQLKARASEFTFARYLDALMPVIERATA